MAGGFGDEALAEFPAVEQAEAKAFERGSLGRLGEIDSAQQIDRVTAFPFKESLVLGHPWKFFYSRP